jgi:ATP-dependent Clp protease adaptor protein ClpS
MSFLYYQRTCFFYQSESLNILFNETLKFYIEYNLKEIPLSIMSENNDNDSNNDNDQVDGNTKLATKPKTKIPSLYRVLMMNDDYTPMEFVIEVLEKFFQKNREEATQIMLHVHQRGVGVCGVYTYDLAETKAMQVMNYARKYEHPLQVQLEKE